MPSTSGCSATLFRKKCWRSSTCVSGASPAGRGRSFHGCGRWERRRPHRTGRGRAYSPGEMSFQQFPVYRGETLDGGCHLEGPAIVELPQTTLVVPSTFAVASDEAGSFVLTRRGGPEQGG